jgi:hypothetical protein
MLSAQTSLAEREALAYDNKDGSTFQFADLSVLLQMIPCLEAW